MDHVAAGHLSYIGDSIVCPKTNFGAGTIISNFRHDGRNHRSMINGELVDTCRRKFGSIIGDNVHTGIHSAIYPGRKIWPDVAMRPGTVVQKDLKETMKPNELVDLNLRHFWHPCTQMKDCKTLPPLPVETASGSIITLKDGRRLTTASAHGGARVSDTANRVSARHSSTSSTNSSMSSWQTAVRSPSQCFARNSRNSHSGLERVYLAENGSVSVEIAMKMSLQYHMQTGHPEKNLFAALHNGYHGETILTLAAGNCELYSKTVPPSLSENTKARTALLYQRRRIAGMGAHARRSVEKDRGATRRTCGPDRGDCI